MKRNERANSQVTKSILGELGRTQKTKDKGAVTKPVIQESPVKPPDLSHDGGGAYNANLTYLQQ
jgi:hypothetical protein